MDRKPDFKPTEPESFDINISDRSGYKSLLSAIAGLFALLAAILLIAQSLIYLSPYFVSPQLERKIFGNTTKYFFKEGQISKPLTNFSKKLVPDNTDVEFYVLDSPLLNAFCTPGNKIFVTTELLKSVDSENELAFIMAHELGHSHFRHNLRNLSLNIILKLFLSSIDVISSSTDFLSLGYSRKMESQADQFAIKILKAYYGHTLGADDFFTKTQIESENSSLLSGLKEYTSSHPTHENRIQNIKKTQDRNSNFTLVQKNKSDVFKELKTY